MGARIYDFSIYHLQRGYPRRYEVEYGDHYTTETYRKYAMSDMIVDIENGRFKYFKNRYKGIKSPITEEDIKEFEWILLQA